MRNGGAYGDSPLLPALRERASSFPVNGPDASAKGVPAVVLAPLVLPHWDAPLEEADFLYIKRSSQLRQHAGQIGFPGGVVEAEDASLLDAGKREALEEVALNPERVELLAQLPNAWTPSGFQLYPFLVATDQQHFVPEAGEVETLHRVNLRVLLECPARCEMRTWEGKTYRVVYFDLEELCIWGVTGRITEHILSTFFDWEPPSP